MPRLLQWTIGIGRLSPAGRSSLLSGPQLEPLALAGVRVLTDQPPDTIMLLYDKVPILSGPNELVSRAFSVKRMTGFQTSHERCPRQAEFHCP